MQKIYTVIHASDREQIIRNLDRTLNAGADGTFVINHGGISLREMLETVAELKVKMPKVFIGMNVLSGDSVGCFQIAESVKADGLWLDESYIRLNPRYDEYLKEMDEARKVYTGQYFGSVAFKTHAQVGLDEALKVAVKSLPHVDVVTTSGAGTGSAPDVERIEQMKKVIGDKPLAIASGMSPENIELFPSADAVLAATGLQDSWTELNEKKIALMVSRKRK
jgi:predicted TIM-barrel enzyme